MNLGLHLDYDRGFEAVAVLGHAPAPGSDARVPAKHMADLRAPPPHADIRSTTQNNPF